MDGSGGTTDDDLHVHANGAPRREGQVQEPDPAAIRAACAGDLDAFESLVRAYQAPVWRFLRGLVGDAHLAEDLAQETFVRAFRHLPGFAFRSKFSTWLFRIAHNVAIDARRSRGRRLALVGRLEPPRDTPGPELGAELAAAIAALPPKLRSALLLVEVMGMSCAETADVLGIPDGTVKSRLFHARAQLVKWYSVGEEASR